MLHIIINVFHSFYDPNRIIENIIITIHHWKLNHVQVILWKWSIKTLYLYGVMTTELLYVILLTKWKHLIKHFVYGSFILDCYSVLKLGKNMFFLKVTKQKIRFKIRNYVSLCNTFLISCFLNGHFGWSHFIRCQISLQHLVF